MRNVFQGGSAMASNDVSAIVEEKRQLRTLVLKRRSSIPPQVKEAKSAAICSQVARLFGLEPDNATEGVDSKRRDGLEAKLSPRMLISGNDMCETRLRTGSRIALYSAFEDEVNLSCLARQCYEAGLRVAFPCMNPRNEPHAMCMRLVSGVHAMCMREVRERSWAACSAPFLANPLLRLPVDDERLVDFPIIDPETIEAIVVPLVAFDEAGRRLGYGGGNYDSFLPFVSPQCLVVGVAFCEQHVERLPAESHDLALPTIVYA